MADLTTVYGEEFCAKCVGRQDLIARDAPEEIIVGVFDNSTDSVTDTSDYDGDPSDLTGDDITTEPTDGNYTQKRYSLDSADVEVKKVSGNWRIEFTDHTFDMINTTGDVDHYFVLGKFQSDEAGDSAQNWHLLTIGPLEQNYSLSNVDQLENVDAGIQFA